MATVTVNAPYDFTHPDFSTPYIETNPLFVAPGRGVKFNEAFNSATVMMFDNSGITFIGDNLEVSGKDIVAGSVVELVYQGNFNWMIAGVSAPAVPLFQPFKTASLADDPEVFSILLNGDDTITGSPGADILIGLDGNDQIKGGGGNDKIDGGTGVDYAIFTGLMADYTITIGKDGVTVEDKIAGRDGRDNLINVERLVFSDYTRFLDVNGNFGDVYRTIAAITGKAPIPAQVVSGIKELDHGTTLTDYIHQFLLQEEQSRLGSSQSLGPDNYIQNLYHYLLGRDPEVAGAIYWVSQIQADVPDESITAQIMQSEEAHINWLTQVESRNVQALIAAAEATPVALGLLR